MSVYNATIGGEYVSPVSEQGTRGINRRQSVLPPTHIPTHTHILAMGLASQTYRILLTNIIFFFSVHVCVCVCGTYPSPENPFHYLYPALLLYT